MKKELEALKADLTAPRTLVPLIILAGNAAAWTIAVWSLIIINLVAR